MTWKIEDQATETRQITAYISLYVMLLSTDRFQQQSFGIKKLELFSKCLRAVDVWAQTQDELYLTQGSSGQCRYCKE